MVSEPTVFIVDDDPSSRRGVTRLVQAAGMNAESYSSAESFLASDRLRGPGCIVLDVRMKEMTGPELQEELGRGEDSMPIVFLSAYGDVPITAEALKKGAIDFLEKPVDGKDLLDAIRLALVRDAESRAQRALRDSVQRDLDKLTPRESQVMTYVITGAPNKAVAVELGISEETVKIHRRRVMEKLGIRSVAELVRLCERGGITPAEIDR